MLFLFICMCPFVVFHVPPIAHKDHQVHFSRSAHHLSIHLSIHPPNGKSVPVQRVNLSQGLDLAFILADFHEVPADNYS